MALSKDKGHRIRLGILGTLSSHTDTICGYAANDERVDLVGVFGDDYDRTNYISNKYNVPQRSCEELLNQCDVVAIMFRDGSKHLSYAEPFIRKSIPVFIDKPITISVADVDKIVTLAREYNCPILGGSSLKYSKELLSMKGDVSENSCLLSGFMSFPVYFNSPYGGFHFYSHHLIEAMLTVFGTDVKSVTSHKKESLLMVIVSYSSFQVILNYAVDDNQWIAGFFGKNGYKMIPFSLTDAAEKQYEEIIKLATENYSAYSGDYFQKVVRISCAIEQSFAENCTIQI